MPPSNVQKCCLANSAQDQRRSKDKTTYKVQEFPKLHTRCGGLPIMALKASVIINRSYETFP
jgi:hypothetical protein